MFNPLQSSVAAVLPGLVVMSRMYVILAETGAQLIKLQTESVCYAIAENARLYATLSTAGLPGNGTVLMSHGPEPLRLADMSQAYTHFLSQWSASVSGLVGESLETCLAAGRVFDDGLSAGRSARPGGSIFPERRVVSAVIDFPDRRSEAMKRAMASNASPSRSAGKKTRK